MPKAGTDAAPKAAADAALKPVPEQGGIDVNWPPTDDFKWITTPPAVQGITAITRYCLTYNDVKKPDNSDSTLGRFQ